MQWWSSMLQVEFYRLMIVSGPIIWCCDFAVIFVVLTEVCHVFCYFFAMIFYCPYLCVFARMMLCCAYSESDKKSSVDQAFRDELLRLVVTGYYLITRYIVITKTLPWLYLIILTFSLFCYCSCYSNSFCVGCRVSWFRSLSWKIKACCFFFITG